MEFQNFHVTPYHKGGDVLPLHFRYILICILLFERTFPDPLLKGPKRAFIPFLFSQGPTTLGVKWLGCTS